ncbi:hypothetical protein PFISCL1PPCAC_27702, partial [Pristionchus fissidentatus]
YPSLMFIVLFSLLAVGFVAAIESNEIYTTEVADVPKEESIYLQVLQLVEPKLREFMLNQGIPEGAVEEFFELGFLKPQQLRQLSFLSNIEKIVEMMQWATKWTKKHAEKLEKLNCDELQKFQIRVTDEASSVLNHLFVASARLACFSRANTINVKDIDELIGSSSHFGDTKHALSFFPYVLHKLSPIEKDLLEGVSPFDAATAADVDSAAQVDPNQSDSRLIPLLLTAFLGFIVGVVVCLLIGA